MVPLLAGLDRQHRGIVRIAVAQDRDTDVLKHRVRGGTGKTFALQSLGPEKKIQHVRGLRMRAAGEVEKVIAPEAIRQPEPDGRRIVVVGSDRLRPRTHIAEVQALNARPQRLHAGHVVVADLRQHGDFRGQVASENVPVKIEDQHEIVQRVVEVADRLDEVPMRPEIALLVLKDIARIVEELDDAPGDQVEPFARTRHLVTRLEKPDRRTGHADTPPVVAHRIQRVDAFFRIDPFFEDGKHSALQQDAPFLP